MPDGKSKKNQDDPQKKIEVYDYREEFKQPIDNLRVVTRDYPALRIKVRKAILNNKDEVKILKEAEEKTLIVIEKGKCFCGKHYFDGDWIKGENVIEKKLQNNVSVYSNPQKLKYILLHRTAGWDMDGALKMPAGTHFYIDKNFRDRKNINGGIFQVSDFRKYTGHLRKIDHNSRVNFKQHHDIVNNNSIGIEVCGMAYTKDKEGNYINVSSGNIAPEVDREPLTDGYADKDKGTVYWDKLTDSQTKSTACLVKLLMDKFDIPLENIYIHEEIQTKTAGEGDVVKKAIWPYLLNEKKF